MVLSACGATTETQNAAAPAAEAPVTATETPAATEAPAKEEPAAAETPAAEEAPAAKDDVPREHKAALEKAELYAETMSMSKKGIYEQLTSEYGEKFDKDAADYAMENIEFDWKENALKKAQTYAETMSMSDSAIYDQLVSESGEKFTEEEAKYAMENLK